MLQMHSLKSSFEAVSYFKVGIGLLAQLGPLVYHGVSLMNAASTVASDPPLIYQKLIPTRTIPLAPTKTTDIPIAGTPVFDTQFTLCAAGLVLIVYYGKRFLRGRRRPPPGSSSRRSSDRTSPGHGSPGSGPPTPPPDSGALSGSIPPPKGGWWGLIFWLLNIFTVALAAFAIWYFWRPIVKLSVLSVVATLMLTLPFLVGSVASTCVTIRRKARRHFSKVKKHLSNYFGQSNTRYPRTMGVGINLLLVLWGCFLLLLPVAVVMWAYHGHFKHSPEFQELVFDWNTSWRKWFLARFAGEFTRNHLMYIFGPFAVLVLYCLCSTYPEEHMDTFSVIVAELIENNNIVMELLRAPQPRVPRRLETPTDEQDRETLTGGEDTPGDAVDQVPLESHPEAPANPQNLGARTGGEDTEATLSDGTPMVLLEGHAEAPADEQDREACTNDEDPQATPRYGAAKDLQAIQDVSQHAPPPPETPIDHGELEGPANGIRSIPWGRVGGESGSLDDLV